METNSNSKWQITFRIDRVNGKPYIKQISSRSTKIFVYVTLVAALWTTSAYVFFYYRSESEWQNRKVQQYLSELANMKAATSETGPTAPTASESTKEVLTLALQSDNSTEASNTGSIGVVLENIVIHTNAKTATIKMSLRKTSRKLEIKGKLAGVLLLRNSLTGGVERVSSRPGLIPPTLEKAAVQALGLYFRAKQRVDKRLVFALPDNVVFDDVSAELTIVMSNGESTKILIPGPKDQIAQPLKIGNASSAPPSIR